MDIIAIIIISSAVALLIRLIQFESSVGDVPERRDDRMVETYIQLSMPLQNLSYFVINSGGWRYVPLNHTPVSANGTGKERPMNTKGETLLLVIFCALFIIGASTVAIGANLMSFDQATSEVWRTLMITGIGIIATSFVIAYFLVRKALENDGSEIEAGEILEQQAY